MVFFGKVLFGVIFSKRTPTRNFFIALSSFSRSSITWAFSNDCTTGGKKQTKIVNKIFQKFPPSPTCRVPIDFGHDLRFKFGVRANDDFMIFSKSGWCGAHAMVHLKQYYNGFISHLSLSHSHSYNRQNVENNNLLFTIVIDRMCYYNTTLYNQINNISVQGYCGLFNTNILIHCIRE